MQEAHIGITAASPRVRELPFPGQTLAVALVATESSGSPFQRHWSPGTTCFRIGLPRHGCRAPSLFFLLISPVA